MKPRQDQEYGYQIVDLNRAHCSIQLGAMFLDHRPDFNRYRNVKGKEYSIEIFKRMEKIKKSDDDLFILCYDMVNIAELLHLRNVDEPIPFFSFNKNKSNNLIWEDYTPDFNRLFSTSKILQIERNITSLIYVKCDFENDSYEYQKEVKWLFYESFQKHVPVYIFNNHLDLINGLCIQYQPSISDKIVY